MFLPWFRPRPVIAPARWLRVKEKVLRIPHTVVADGVESDSHVRETWTPDRPIAILGWMLMVNCGGPGTMALGSVFEVHLQLNLVEFPQGIRDVDWFISEVRKEIHTADYSVPAEGWVAYPQYQHKEVVWVPQGFYIRQEAKIPILMFSGVKNNTGKDQSYDAYAVIYYVDERDLPR